MPQVLPLARLHRLTCMTCSISAGEGRNALLRNFLGKVAANLNLVVQLPSSQTPLQLIDAFCDEGHRVGAYYLQVVMPLPSPLANARAQCNATLQ